MRYCFILGSSPLLSIAEIHAVLLVRHCRFSVLAQTDNVLELLCDSPPDISVLMQVLGGTIKIGLFLEKIEYSRLNASVFSHYLTVCPGLRLQCGISFYSLPRGNKKERMTPSRVKRLSLELKKIIKNRGGSCRVIVPTSGNALSSVVVEKNHLLGERGYEFMAIEGQCDIALYRTVAVQPFEQFSRLDYTRPSRSMEIGMLPPKVARMMINLTRTASPQSTILVDPFCGTGTLLEQAALVGFRKLIGSDMSDASLNAARTNWRWLTRHEHDSASASVRFITSDARQLHLHLKPHSIDTLVSETTLGPILSGKKRITEQEVMRIEWLLIDFFANARKILKPSAHICVALPFWPEQHQYRFMPTIHHGLRNLGYHNDIYSLLALHTALPHGRPSLLWHRPGQRTGREIIILSLMR